MSYKNNNQVNDIVIDDGSKTYNIKNKKGERLGQFTFKPSDTNIISRYEEVVEFLNRFAIPDNTDESRKKAENEIIEKISFLIGADARESFFSIMGAFSVLPSGELFFENVVNAVANVIEREMAVRTKKVQSRVNKYVAKYHK